MVGDIESVMELYKEVSKEPIPLPFQKDTINILFNTLFDLIELDPHKKTTQPSSLEELITTLENRITKPVKDLNEHPIMLLTKPLSSKIHNKELHMTAEGKLYEVNLN